MVSFERIDPDGDLNSGSEFGMLSGVRMELLLEKRIEI